ncbi:MAG: ATP synthase F1 subunit gamma [Prolixibacteraceae bacterium]
MSNLKEIRTRISSVKTTRQVTSAMKMVSAAKLKKAQDAILRIRPYAAKIQEILTTLTTSIENTDDSLYMEQRSPEKVLMVLISSNRGLCGAFNTTVSKKAVELAVSKYRDQLEAGNADFYAIGKQGERFLKARKMNVVAQGNHIFDILDFEQVAPVAEQLMANFKARRYDRIVLVYNQFKNAAVQITVAEQFLPVETPVKEKKKVETNYIFEPSQQAIVAQLIPRSLKIQLYKALLDSNAAEHGARMTAMHQATDNATELIQELTITFNKVRQTAITNEILEVTNGAEALR